MLPRLRIMAVSMERLEIARARIAAVSIDMIHLNPVPMLEEQPAVATAPLLRFQQLGRSWTGIRMPSLSRTPVDLIAVIEAAVSSDLEVPRDRHPTMGQEVHGIRISGRGGKGPPVLQLTPVPFPQPAGGFCWVSPVCPAAELFPGEKVKPFKDRLTHTGAVVVRPAPNFRVELLDQGALSEGCSVSYNPPKLRQMRLDVGLGRFDQGLIAEAMVAGAFP